MRAVRFHRTGGPEVLQVDEIPVPEPGPGEAQVRVELAGLNFIDTYLRSGFYDPGPLPAIAGKEGAGLVERIGPGVEGVAEGDRVAFFDARGSYAQLVVHPAERLLPLPDDLDPRLAAALPLQGMTAHYLIHTIRPLESGDTVLVHAAAGGVGHLAAQMAMLSGATVFGTCGSSEKAERLQGLGIDHVIRYDEEDFVERVLEETGGRGVDLAIDGVGRATFPGTVRATRIRGHVVLFGQASGSVEPLRPRQVLGSRTLTTASLFDYARDRSELLDRAGEVFRQAAEGRLEVWIDRVLPLEEAGLAHRLLEGRQTSGKVLFAP
ncbi:MAG: quinone oxidoreductase family protein [Gemmatimonadota bacterium]